MSQQSERLRTIGEEHERFVSNLKMKHSGDLTESKERSLTAQQDLRQKYESERARLVEQHATEISAIKHAQEAAEARIAQLTVTQHELQLQVSRVIPI